jgi:chromosome segregation ATPase
LTGKIIVISGWNKVKLELRPEQAKLETEEGRVPVCSHEDLVEKLLSWEKQLEESNSDLADLKHDLDDAKAEIGKLRELAEENGKLVTQILRLMERWMVEKDAKELEEKENQIVYC